MKQGNLFNLKPIKKRKRKRKPNSANRYRSKIKQFGYTEKQIYQILLNHKQARNRPKIKHRKRINHNKKKYALNQVILSSKGKSTLSVSAIARKYHISRVTLYRWYKKWLANPHRAYYSNLFKK